MSKRFPYQLTLMSQSRTSQSDSSSNYDINIILPQKGNDFALEFVSIPGSIYNISSANNSIDTSLGNTSVAAGTYDINSLVAALQTALQTVDATYTVTVSTITNKVTIACNNNFSLLFGSGPNASKSVASNIGFNASDTTSAKTVTGQNVYDMLLNQMLFITIDALGTPGQVNIKQINYQYTFSVPILVNTGNFYSYASNALYPQTITTAMSDTQLRWHVRMFDSTGAEAQLNGRDWIMVMSRSGC